MKNISSKIKIVILVVAFALFAILMFMYGYDILATRNQALADAAAQRHLEYEVLQREQRNFDQGKKDLAELSEKKHPPTDLFSKDTKVVKEIQMLEATAARFGLTMSLNVSGTVKTAPKVPGVSGELYLVPYIVVLNGPFEDIMRYIQAIEHMPFVSYTKLMSLSYDDVEKNVQATINSDFYIKK
jgi:Tfp pilus assembly protein PilO